MKITAYAVQRRLATSAIVLALVVLGLYGLWRLPMDYLPNITYPLIKIQIKWPGATPEEIDTDIADHVERLMSTVEHLDYLESSSIEGLYNLNVYFEYGADIDVAFQDALAGTERPAGYAFDFGGSAEMMTDMKNTVLAVFGFALFFSFIVLTVQFNSLKLPGLILGSVPACLTGVVLLLYLSRLPLGATVIIGVLVVVAATVNDGVLLLIAFKKKFLDLSQITRSYSLS